MPRPSRSGGALRDKHADALRLTRITHQVGLGVPAVGAVQ
jgi:hypothetical protein